MATSGYTYETQYTSPNSTPQSLVGSVFGTPRSIDGFTYHWWGDPNESPTYEGVVSWLCRPGGNTSAHYVATGTGRRVACIVSPWDAAWHSGNALGNATTIGIEMDPRAREEDYEVVADLSADLISAFGDKLKYRHSDWFQTACPGVYDINKIDAMSYQRNSGPEWGKTTLKNQPAPQPLPPAPAPQPVPNTVPEWVVNLKDIQDTQLQVLKAEGVRRVNLITMQEFDDVIPRGTNIDIAKETTVNGRKFYISSFSAKQNAAVGLYADALGVPVTPPVADKPEWLTNLKDIADQDFWTRSEVAVLNLADGTTKERLPVNTKVRVVKTTHFLGNDLMVLDGEKTAIESLYLSDTPITDPNADIKQRLSKIEAFINSLKQLLSNWSNK